MKNLIAGENSCLFTFIANRIVIEDVGNI